MDDAIADQKAKYEEKKEQERKRRFAILLGHIKPIQTTFHLKDGDHAYYEATTERMADKEYVESYTTGQARSPFLKGGILRGNTRINTTTKQVRSARNVPIDSGKMLFTNKRILFIGKEVISIPYEEILSVDFSNSAVAIKYPDMLKAESYSLAGDEAELYYQGIQRLIGKDKSKIELKDVQVPWAEFESPKANSLDNQWYNSYAVTVLLLIFLFPVGLFTMWKYTGWNKIVKWAISVIAGVFAFLLIIGSSAQQPSSNQSVVSKTSPTPMPTKAPTDLSHWQNLKKLDDKVISYNSKLATQCEYIILAPDVSAISEWKTTDDPSYDTLFASMGIEQGYTDKISPTSDKYSLWKNMSDIDNKLLDDFQDVENQCDSLSSDVQSMSTRNVSSYASTVQSDKADIDSLMAQRKNILSELGYK